MATERLGVGGASNQNRRFLGKERRKQQRKNRRRTRGKGNKQ